MLKSEITKLVKSAKTNDTETAFWCVINGVRYKSDFGEFSINGVIKHECHTKIEFVNLVYIHVNSRPNGEKKSV